MAYAYVCIYEPTTSDFNNNGLRVLYPKTCQISQSDACESSGEYTLSLTHPLDKWGTWRFIREHYIVKSQGQLFRIYKKSLSMSSDGSYEIRAEAMHIFYDLNAYFITSSLPMLLDGADALKFIVTNVETKRGNKNIQPPTSRFTFETDIKAASDTDYKALRSAYYEHVSVTAALISADNCFLNIWGGELERDNFKVKIKKKQTKTKSFSISYGSEMTEIQFEADYSSYCSALYYDARVYRETVENNEIVRKETVARGTVSLENPGDSLPIPPMGYYSFEVNIGNIPRLPKGIAETALDLPTSDNTYGDIYFVYSTKTYYEFRSTQSAPNGQWQKSTVPTVPEIQAACKDIAKEYLLKNCQPVYNYRVSFADLKNYDLYKDFYGLQRCDLGDVGLIYHTELGINLELQITKKVIDGLTGETLSIELGNLRRSLTTELAKRR